MYSFSAPGVGIYIYEIKRIHYIYGCSFFIINKSIYIYIHIYGFISMFVYESKHTYEVHLGYIRHLNYMCGIFES